MSGAPLCELRGVQARYAARTILRGVDLTLDAGELVALLGPNGAGKSTVLKAIVGLAEITGGTVLVDGRSQLGSRPRDNLARGVVYLPQGGQVFGPLTVAGNLALAASLLVSPAAAAARIDDAVAGFSELTSRWRQRAATLSGGQKQQLALAMALLAEPRLLLVDEPTIGLSAPLARQALARIDEVRRSGAAVLLVEQNVGLALDVADRAVLLVAGRTVDVAPTAAIRGDAELLERFTLGLEPAGTAPIVDT